MYCTTPTVLHPWKIEDHGQANGQILESNTSWSTQDDAGQRLPQSTSQQGAGDDDSWLFVLRDLHLRHPWSRRFGSHPGMEPCVVSGGLAAAAGVRRRTALVSACCDHTTMCGMVCFSFSQQAGCMQCSFYSYASLLGQLCVSRGGRICRGSWRGQATPPGRPMAGRGRGRRCCRGASTAQGLCGKRNRGTDSPTGGCGSPAQGSACQHCHGAGACMLLSTAMVPYRHVAPFLCPGNIC